MRTISLFGLSDVKVQFTYDFTYREAAQLGHQPADASSGPCPTARSRRSRRPARSARSIRYRVVGPPGYSVTDLKTIQDWILQRRFKAVPGVIDVTAGAARPRPTTSPSISTGCWPTA